MSWLHGAVGRAQNREEEAGDTVVFKSSTIPFRGTIVEYTGEAITIRLKNGKTRRFPSSDVLRFETKRSGAWLDAVEHYEAHEYILAATDFEKAFEQEPRTWVRREILARLAWCYRLQRKLVEAGETFLLVYENDANTPFFSAIPLEWIGGETSPDLRARARQWIGREQSSAAVLLGASHLLAGSDRATAIEKLKELTKNPDRRIAILAAAQVWRTQVARADEDALGRWEQVIRRLPSSLRAGPYYVLGKGYALRRQPEQAALKLLWVPLVYNEDPMLAAQACLEAADALTAKGQTSGAQALYREVIVKYGFTPASGTARLQLQGLIRPKTGSRTGAS